jgi:hypothetical protein
MNSMHGAQLVPSDSPVGRRIAGSQLSSCEASFR